MLIRREDFGNISNLKPSSHKKVWFTCEECGMGVLRQYNIYLKSKPRCLSCRSKDINNNNRENNRKSQIIRWQNADRKSIGDNISKGQKLAWQSNPNRKSKPIVSFEIIKRDLESIGYIVLTKEIEYVSASKTPIKFRCNAGHLHHIFYDKFKLGQRCGKCSNNILQWEQINLAFQHKNLKLLDDLVNARKPLNYICNLCGHVGSISYDNLTKGHGCAGCANNAKIEVTKEQLIRMIGDNYTLTVDKDILYRTDIISLLCKNKHQTKLTAGDMLRGKRCNECDKNKTKKEEQEIAKFISSLGITIETNNRSVISPYELDIYLPDKNIAIEYDGLYWHGEASNNKDKKYHINKTNLCNNKGIQLIHIFEDEWLYKKNIVKDKLKHLLRVSSALKVYARKCFIREIDINAASSFCDLYHIQGYAQCKIKLGAFFAGELVAVMTFSKFSIAKGRAASKDSWELSRFCTKYTVVGIASKLLSYFKNNYAWNHIISYADKRWSVGNVYKKLGFLYKRDTKPGYWYTLGKKRLHRFGFRRNTLSGDGTEWQIMQSRGYDRIWDCGHMLFEIIKEV